MPVETKERPLSQGDVARIVERALEERQESQKKLQEAAGLSDAEVARLKLQAGLVGESVAAALDRRAKNAEAEATAKAEEEKKKKQGWGW